MDGEKNEEKWSISALVFYLNSELAGVSLKGLKQQNSVTDVCFGERKIWLNT